MSGSFSKRLELYSPFGFTSAPLDPANPPPAIDGGDGAPHVLFMKGAPSGIAHPFVGVVLETGSESQRLLAAVVDVIHDLVHASDQSVMLTLLAELAEAHEVAARHLDQAFLKVDALPRRATKAVH